MIANDAFIGANGYPRIVSDKLAQRARAEIRGAVSGVAVGVVDVTGAGVVAVVVVVGAGAAGAVDAAGVAGTRSVVATVVALVAPTSATAGAAITRSATSIASAARMGIPGRFPEGGAISSPSAQSPLLAHALPEAHGSRDSPVVLGPVHGREPDDQRDG
jgi:hypothetical protein